VYLQEFRSHTLKPTLVVVQSLSLITVTETDDDEQHQGRAAQRTGPSSKAPSLAPCCSFLPRNFAIFQFKRVSSSPQCCTGDGTARPPPPPCCDRDLTLFSCFPRLAIAAKLVLLRHGETDIKILRGARMVSAN
jgi:hypothetical protein